MKPNNTDEIYKVWEGSMLTNPSKGVVTVTTWWSDGSVTTHETFKYPISYTIVMPLVNVKN